MEGIIEFRGSHQVTVNYSLTSRYYKQDNASPIKYLLKGMIGYKHAKVVYEIPTVL